MCELQLDVDNIDAPLELNAEKVIRGRLTDIEGRPAVGVRIMIASVMPTTKDEYLSQGIRYRNSKQALALWPAPVVTDAAGHFAVHNIAAAHGVFLEIDGNDRFAPQSLAINTGASEQRGERDGTYRPQFVKNLKPDEEAVIPLAPVQVFEGEVTYADTGKPAPHARITIWASQQEFGSMLSVGGKADANGHYRVSPNPGIRFGITVYPPDGTAYLARRNEPIDWQDAQTHKQVNVTLPRGVLVRGKVVESNSGTPVAGATIQYEPEGAHNPNAKDDILTGWQGIQLSNDAGEFEIAVLPGPGHLLVHGTKGKFILNYISGGELQRGTPGGRRNYAHAIERVDPKVDSEPIELTVKLDRGATVSGNLIDEQGQPPSEALLISSLNVHPTTLHWRGGGSVPVTNGRFELAGLDPEQRYTVYFLDSKRRTGATAIFKAGDEPRQITLQPCAQATARFVDAEKQPVSGLRPLVTMLVSPGVDPNDIKAIMRGEMAADSDFLANIDRANYRNTIASDADGRITFPALIPGATYRIGRAKEFTVRDSQTIELGDIATEEAK